MLFLAHVEFNVFWFGTLPDDHAGIDFGAGADKQSAAVLGAEQSIGDGFAGFKGNE